MSCIGHRAIERPHRSPSSPEMSLVVIVIVIVVVIEIFKALMCGTAA
jgi:hypothetical protein